MKNIFRIIIGLVATVALLSALTPRAVAQSSPSCYRVTSVFCSEMSIGWGVSCQPPLPLGATNCQIAQFDGIYCQVVTNVCLTPLAWCPTCGKYVPTASSPINLTSGNTYIQEQDLRIPGLGGGLSLTRTWNSIVPVAANGYQSGMFGLQWRSTYEERIFSGSGVASGYLAYLRGDGGIWYFPSTGGSLAAPANESATIAQNGTQSWTITFKNGEKRVFSYTSGSLTSISDRNGNTTTLSYDAVGRLTTVTDPVPRHLYFSYGSGSSLLVTGITSDIGVSLSYSYDSQGRLIQVTEPDQSTIAFQYNTQSLITAVTDSVGKILEVHTYDNLARGATASRANGVETVSVSYPQ
jgi:YD repeat-containing protein